jgi:hypothetical protein
MSYSYQIGNRTRDLPAFSTAPQATTLPGGPLNKRYESHPCANFMKRYVMDVFGGEPLVGPRGTHQTRGWEGPTPGTDDMRRASRTQPLYGLHRQTAVMARTVAQRGHHYWLVTSTGTVLGARPSSCRPHQRWEPKPGTADSVELHRRWEHNSSIADSIRLHH